jgi:hypothetical protein
MELCIDIKVVEDKELIEGHLIRLDSWTMEDSDALASRLAPIVNSLGNLGPLSCLGRALALAGAQSLSKDHGKLVTALLHLLDVEPFGLSDQFQLSVDVSRMLDDDERLIRSLDEALRLHPGIRLLKVPRRFKQGMVYSDRVPDKAWIPNN